MSHTDDRIIPTVVLSMLREVAEGVVKGAGLALVRGPAGIGKSFALDVIAAEMEAAGTTLVRSTAAEVTSGSISSFARAILSQYRIELGSAWDGVEALGDLLAGHPFRAAGPKVLFIVDEAQVLKPTILETIRALWDRGDRARRDMEGGPAFGCMLVGNDTFMGKGGTQRIAGFRPLRSRVTHDVHLPRPSRSEHDAFARAMFPANPELQAALSGFGQDSGNLRAQAVAVRQAKLNAGGQPLTDADLRLAIKFMGGK